VAIGDISYKIIISADEKNAKGSMKNIFDEARKEEEKFDKKQNASFKNKSLEFRRFIQEMQRGYSGLFNHIRMGFGIGAGISLFRGLKSGLEDLFSTSFNRVQTAQITGIDARRLQTMMGALARFSISRDDAMQSLGKVQQEIALGMRGGGPLPAVLQALGGGIRLTDKKGNAADPMQFLEQVSARMKAQNVPPALMQTYLGAMSLPPTLALALQKGPRAIEAAMTDASKQNQLSPDSTKNMIRLNNALSKLSSDTLVTFENAIAGATPSILKAIDAFDGLTEKFNKSFTSTEKGKGLLGAGIGALIGGTAGFFAGGPLGAALGAALLGRIGAGIGLSMDSFEDKLVKMHMEIADADYKANNFAPLPSVMNFNIHHYGDADGAYDVADSFLDKYQKDRNARIARHYHSKTMH